ncbi:DUF6578 domain-containing protein [Streptomyces sp. RB17]|uniref:DUF6578 domain-containing protein n=1 Tax=Streptomyces sp. RB17 TaxID=2585197 RepID=UPI001294A463|nr:DUF6578 domain-containing protein [Streptomyces sp. RB17]
MPRMRVFYENWQMECCGTPFAVGDEVSWPLVAYDAEGVREGHGYGARAWVENHGGPDRPAVGRVHAVDLVHEEYSFSLPDPAPEPVEPRDGVVFRSTGRGLEPVPGTLTLEPSDSCPKWFEEVDRGTVDGLGRVRRTRGALVTLDVPDATPPQPGDHR